MTIPFKFCFLLIPIYHSTTSIFFSLHTNIFDSRIGLMLIWMLPLQVLCTQSHLVHNHIYLQV